VPVIVKTPAVRVPKGKGPQDPERTQYHQAQANRLNAMRRGHKPHGEPGDDQHPADQQSHDEPIPEASVAHTVHSGPPTESRSSTLLTVVSRSSAGSAVVGSKGDDHPEIFDESGQLAFTLRLVGCPQDR
jgi:hypothetical protein